MSTASILTLNFVLHSLLIAAVGWFIVRFLLRGAMRRAIAANMVLLFALIGPFNIATWPASEVIERPPVYGALQQTLTTDWPDWRIAVSPTIAASAVPQAEKPSWTLNDFVTAARWIALSISALLLLRLLIQSIRIQCWAWQLRDLSAQELDKIPAGLSFERLSVFDGDCTPCVAGWFRPIIAVPAAAFEKLTPQQWRWLLRHEAEHLRCGDTTAVLLQNILRALLWWNPFVHALAEEYTQSREEACDAAALGETAENSAYATFLLECAETCSAAPALLVPIIHTRPAKRLKARLTALMEARGTQKIGALFTLACVAFALLMPLLVASLGLATPAQAQPVINKDDGKLHLRVYRVRPDFLLDQKNAQQTLEQLGAAFPEGTSAQFEPATSQLVVKNTVTQLDKIESIVNKRNEQPVQVLLQVRLIQAPAHIGKHEQVMSAAAFKEVLKEHNQQKGVDLLSAPSVTTKFLHQAIVEVAREVTRGAETKKVGLTVKLDPGLQLGGKLPLSARVEMGIDPSTKECWLPENADFDRIITRSVSANSQLQNGETLVLHLDAPVKPVTAFITASGLTPEGQTTAFDTVFSAVPPIQEHVLLSVHTADFKEDVSAVLHRASGSKEPAPPQPRPEIREAFLLNGILTAPQFRAFFKEATVKLQAAPEQTVRTQDKAEFDLAVPLDGLKAGVTPKISGDGHSIDLSIQISSKPGTPQSNITTSVTVWDHQTVILGRGDGKAVFITAHVQPPK